MLYQAYFDVAGHPDQKSKTGWMAIAGFVSNAAKWDAFSDEWNRTLDELSSFLALTEPLKHFHMTDFVARVPGGPYEKLRVAPEFGNQIKARFLAATRRYTRKAFGGALDLAAFHEVNRTFQLIEAYGHPYSLCGHMVIESVRQWQRKVPSRQVLYVFEEGDKGQADFSARCQTTFGFAPTFAPKGTACRPLEAADLFLPGEPE